MAKIFKYIILFVISLCSLIVLTINYHEVDERYDERCSFEANYNVYDNYNFAIWQHSNLSYKVNEDKELIAYSGLDGNMPSAIFYGYHYRREENKNSQNKWDKWITISEWNFFINIYETGLPEESASSYFKGISQGVESSGMDVNLLQYGSCQGFHTLKYPDVVDSDQANTIVVFTDRFAYHITAIDATGYDELEVLLDNLSFEFPSEMTSLPWIMLLSIILLEACLLIIVIVFAKTIKGIGTANTVARAFAIFTFVMICAYVLASIIHSAIAITDLWEFYNRDYISFIWMYPGVVFSLVLLYYRLVKHSESNIGVAFILPDRWKCRLGDSAISRLIVITVCYPCLIGLILAGFLAVPFVLMVYLLFLLGYVITHAVRWILLGEIK